MGTASEIVLDAFRVGNLVPLDATTGIPVVAPVQEAEGLKLLNKYIDSLYGLELGEFNFDWPVPPTNTSPVPARYPLFPRSDALKTNVWPYPPGNVRLLLNLVADTTIYLPQSPDDGARIEVINIGDGTTYNLTIEGSTRLVEGAASVTDTPANFNTRRYLYRADLGDWTVISTLISTSASPLPELYDDLLSIGTFQRLAPRYGRSMAPETVDEKARLMRRLKTQYRQTVLMPSQKPQPFFLPSSDINRTSFGNFGGNSE